jgi:hypothetical protein
MAPKAKAKATPKAKANADARRARAHTGARQFIDVVFEDYDIDALIGRNRGDDPNTFLQIVEIVDP